MVADDRFAWADRNLLYERLDERPPLGQLAPLEECPHVQGKRCDSLYVVQLHPTFRERSLHLARRVLELALTLAVLAYAGSHVRNVQVCRLDGAVKTVEPPLYLGQLRLYGLKLPALLVRHAVHLLVHHLHKVPDVALGEDASSDLIDNEVLEAFRVEPRRLAGVLAPLDERLADVVGELSALGLLPGQRRTAPPALDHPAEEVRAGGAPGVNLLGSPGPHQSRNPSELPFRDDCRERVLNPHGRFAVAGIRAPDERARIRLVGEDVMNHGLRPGLAVCRGDALVVQGLGDVEHATSRLGHPEHSAHDRVPGWVEFQFRTLLCAVLNMDPDVSVGSRARHPEPPRRGLTHSSHDVLRQILRVEVVHALDDGLHQLTRRSVIGVLGDGDHPYPLAPQLGLEGHGVLPLAGEPTEFPYQDDLKRRL